MKTQGTLRKHHSPDFKFKVALEALMGQKTMAQLCSEFGVAATQIKDWKKHLEATGPAAFNRGNKPQAKEPTEDVAYLQKTIGKLKAENDFLEDFAKRHRLL